MMRGAKSSGMLGAMPRLTPCPSCHAHVLVGDRECPHCGATLRSTGSPLAAFVIAGLMLSSCGDDDGNGDVGEPEYGVPATSSSTTGSTTSSATDTGGTTADSITGTGGVEYGTPDTGLDTNDTESTGTGTDGTTGTTSVGEPEYGVPETGTGTSSG